MDKIDKLEKRIVELEETVKALRQNNKKKGFITFGRQISMRSAEAFEESLKDEYSTENYKEKGWDEKFHVLDFSKMLDEAKKARNMVKKLKAWKKHNNTIAATLDDRYHPHWFLLTSFVESAIEYYETCLIEYVLREGKYFDLGGRPEEYDPEKSVQWFDEISKKDAFKKNNKPYKKKIYQEIRERHNDGEDKPYPTNKTIRTHLKEAGRLGK